MRSRPQTLPWDIHAALLPAAQLPWTLSRTWPVWLCLAFLTGPLPGPLCASAALGEGEADLDAVAAAAASIEGAVQIRAPTAGTSSGSDVVALRLVSPVRSTTQEQLKAEIVAAEAALALRAEVDGLPVVYDSPGVSISLRKVSPTALVESGAEVEAPDGASVKIPADPRVKGRHGGPVTVTVTSYHAGDALNKDLPKVKYGADRRIRPVVGGEAEISGGTPKKEDRVDFFMSKTSVSWRGTVDVKVPGLAASVPAHDRPWTPYGRAGDDLYTEEKAEVRQELERLASLPARTHSEERLRGYRRLARKWHPDKHSAEDREKATEVFEYLQELREALGLAQRGNEEGERKQR